MRAPYQILVFPYLKTPKGQIRYCLFKRKDMKVWQAIAGGGEEGETPMGTANRETHEEAAISVKSKFTQLTSVASIPVVAISGFIWGKDVVVIPEYSFGVEVKDNNIHLEKEHTKYEWMTYNKASEKLEWDSNKTALWELNYRLKNNRLQNIRNFL